MSVHHWTPLFETKRCFKSTHYLRRPGRDVLTGCQSKWPFPVMRVLWDAMLLFTRGWMKCDECKSTYLLYHLTNHSARFYLLNRCIILSKMEALLSHQLPPCRVLSKLARSKNKSASGYWAGPANLGGVVTLSLGGSVCFHQELLLTQFHSC